LISRKPTCGARVEMCAAALVFSRLQASLRRVMINGPDVGYASITQISDVSLRLIFIEERLKPGRVGTQCPRGFSLNHSPRRFPTNIVRVGTACPRYNF